MDFSEVTFTQRKTFTKEIIWVDGHARTGKHLHNPIMTSFKNVLPWQLLHSIDCLPYLRRLDKISEELAVETIRREVDYAFYNMQISRDTNFRASDYSSVWNTSDPQEFFQNMFDPEIEKTALEQTLKGESPKVFHLVTHDVLGSGQADLFFKAYPNIKLLNAKRNPANVIHSSYKKKWFSRVGNDPSSFWFGFKTKNSDTPIPWWAVEREEEFHKANDVEKMVMSYNYSYLETEKVKQDYLAKNNLKHLDIHFERILSNPEEYLKEIEGFLGHERSLRTPYIVDKQRAPRDLYKKDFDEIQTFLKENCSAHYYDIIQTRVEEYEKDFKEKYGSTTYDLKL